MDAVDVLSVVMLSSTISFTAGLGVREIIEWLDGRETARESALRQQHRQRPRDVHHPWGYS